MVLAVLLRNGKHASATSSETATIFYALKCDTFAIQLQKSPITIPIPQGSPELIDLGIVRPSITISGIVDTVGQTDHDISAHENMETVSVTRKSWESASSYADSTKIYYVPYKNKLENAVYDWLGSDDQALEIEIGDANVPAYQVAAEPNSNNSVAYSGGTTETGGGVYVVAIQSCRFQVDPATEDRFQFQMQFVCKTRKDFLFT